MRIYLAVHLDVKIVEYACDDNLRSQKNIPNIFFLEGFCHSEAILIWTGFIDTPLWSTTRPRNSIDFFCITGIF